MEMLFDILDRSVQMHEVAKKHELRNNI